MEENTNKKKIIATGDKNGLREVLCMCCGGKAVRGMVAEEVWTPVGPAVKVSVGWRCTSCEDIFTLLDVEEVADGAQAL